MIRQALVLTAVAGVAAMQPAAADNVVYVTVKGCDRCVVQPAAISVVNDERVLDVVPQQMWNGTATLTSASPM